MGAQGWNPCRPAARKGIDVHDGVSRGDKHSTALPDGVKDGQDPATTFDRAQARRAADGLLRASKGLTLAGLSIKELVNEGRR